MSESPEVPDEEPAESKPDMKERMRSFGEKAKAFGEKTGQRSKELGKKVAEATKETTAKAADATKKTTAKVAEAAKETTAKAAEAGKKAGSRLSESTADVSEKISVAAEQAVESVSKGVKQTKEKVKQAKEARDERKAQSAQVPQSTQVIALGPDLPDENPDHEDESQQNSDAQDGRGHMDAQQIATVQLEEPVPESGSAAEQAGKQYVILPPTGAPSMPTTHKTNSASKTFSTTVSNMASTVGQYGPDLVFGWFLLFVVLCTSTNVIAIVSGSAQQVDSIVFGMPHFDLAFDSDVVWAHYVGYGLLLVLLFDSIMLSFSAATLGSYRRILIATVLVWALPAITNGPASLLTPFETNDLLGFLWHILVLPIITLTATIRVGLMLVERESDLPPDLDLPQPQNKATSKEDILHRDATSPLSSNMTIPKLPFEDEIMNATDEIMQKPAVETRWNPTSSFSSCSCGCSSLQELLCSDLLAPV